MIKIWSNRRARFAPSRWLGLILIAVAVFLAIDPDYPVKRGSTPMPSAGRREALLPVAVSPVGEVAEKVEEFVWRWAGPRVAWRLVLLDADLRRIYESEPTMTPHLRPERELASLLASGGGFQWFVEGRIGELQLRSVPALFMVAR